jgi:hypothetical protein
MIDLVMELKKIGYVVLNVNYVADGLRALISSKEGEFYEVKIRKIEKLEIKEAVK